MSEKKRITKRAVVRIISFVTATFVIICVFGIHSYCRAEQYRITMEYSAQRSMAEVDEYMSNIDIALKKSVYASSPKRFRKIATQLWRDCSCAKEALSTLPASTEGADKLYRFFSQVGDYAMYISHSLDEGKNVENMRSSLAQLSNYSSNLKGVIGNMALDIQQGLDFSKLDEIPDENNPHVSDGFYDIKDELTSYPTLIYDGPFSDQQYEKTPKLTQNTSEVERETAYNTALKLCPEARELSNMHDIGGNIPCYVFEGANYSVSITKHGGYPLYMSYDHKVGTATLSTDEAADFANKLLGSLGMNSFKMTGYEIYNDICTFNYAYAHNGIVYYPDLVKISVALDDGAITAFDCTGYVMNHTVRKLPKNLKSEQEAKKLLSKSLAVQNVTTVYIPSGAAEESLCYEFRCLGDGGDTVLVYINAQDLSEEEVLIVLESDHSSLTI